jgi:predicted amidohydrolase
MCNGGGTQGLDGSTQGQYSGGEIMKVELAMVQPRSYARFMRASPEIFGPDSPPEAENLVAAERYAERAADNGAQVIAFPEMYPGPGYDPSELEFEEVCVRMADKARELGSYILFGGIKQQGNRAWNTYNLASPESDGIASYAKMIPAVGEPGEPGDTLGLFDTPLLKIGVVICWEAWFPELSRAVAFSGADLILYPTGGLIYELRESWRTIIAARAAENLVYTACCLNLFGVEAGLSYIFSPEGLLGELLEEGINCAELDLGRLAYLRSQDEAMTTPKLYRAIPGTPRAVQPAVVEAYCRVAKEMLRCR